MPEFRCVQVMFAFSLNFDHTPIVLVLFGALLESLERLSELPGFGGFFLQLVVLPLFLLALRLPQRRKNYSYSLFWKLSWTKILMIDLVCTAFTATILIASHSLMMLLFSKCNISFAINHQTFGLIGRVFDHVSAFVVFLVVFGISGIPKGTEPVRSVSPEYLALSKLCRELVGFEYELNSSLEDDSSPDRPDEQTPRGSDGL